MLKRLLKALRTTRGSRPAAVLGHTERAEEEERIALTAYATFDAPEFERRTGYAVRNEEFFLQAVIHRSYLQMCPPGSFQSNERMEFLGDAVLNLIVAEYLYHSMPEAEEGELSKTRQTVDFAIQDGIVNRCIALFAGFPAGRLQHHDIARERVTHQGSQSQAEGRHHQILIQVPENSA